VKWRKDYYEMNMTPPIPNLLPIHNYHIIETRYKKHLKLCMQKEKSMAEHSDDEQSGSTSDHYILSLLNLTNLSEDSSEKEEDSEHDVSFLRLRVLTANLIMHSI